MFIDAVLVLVLGSWWCVFMLKCLRGSDGWAGNFFLHRDIAAAGVVEIITRKIINRLRAAAPKDTTSKRG